MFLGNAKKRDYSYIKITVKKLTFVFIVIVKRWIQALGFIQVTGEIRSRITATILLQYCFVDRLSKVKLL